MDNAFAKVMKRISTRLFSAIVYQQLMMMGGLTTTIKVRWIQV